MLILSIFRTGDIKVMINGFIVPSHVPRNTIVCTSKIVSNNEESKVTAAKRDKAVIVYMRKTKAFVWKYLASKWMEMVVIFALFRKCCLCLNSTTFAGKDLNNSNLSGHLHPGECARVCQASKKKAQVRIQRKQYRHYVTLLDSWDKQWPVSALLRKHKTLPNIITYCLARDIHCR